MKKIIYLTISYICLLASCSTTAQKVENECTLKEALDGKFYIGAALNANLIDRKSVV